MLHFYSKLLRISLSTVILLIFSSCKPDQSQPSDSGNQPVEDQLVDNQDQNWPSITQTTKPWTRWWWHGSAVTKENLTKELERYKAAGFGGVEITPIYGVKGKEDQFIDYLSPRWMEMLIYTLEEANRLGLGVDMATGTGWPFGGPWIKEENASKYVAHKTWELKEGETLVEKVVLTQEPIIRYAGRDRTPISELQDPVYTNTDLQTKAIDQIRFEKRIPLQVLMAYSDTGESLDLTNKVDDAGDLAWVAEKGNWKLYALFQGGHGKMVERAAPGGEGLVIDHFSEDAIEHYLSEFAQAIKGNDISSLRAFFNDSYEVDDARGQANWTPNLLSEFEARNGYDLREYLPALFGEDETEMNERVLSDYRATISDLLLEKFTLIWQAWAKEKGAIIRNQAHGSPANILDLYAASDIPETEGDDILRIKLASSAANVVGKPLASAEAATWLNEHFTSNLADIKENLDRYLLGGVNHIFYHGTTYSPDDAAWPGHLFYAAVHFSPRNPLWEDLGALNHYVAQTQAFLQNGKPDNDILLYFPAYDRYAARGKELLTHFEGRGEAFESSQVIIDARWLQANGYAFDFISDRQLQDVTVNAKDIVSGGNTYQIIFVPETKYMPLETLEKLSQLAQAGATVVFNGELPLYVPGLLNWQERQTTFDNIQAAIPFESKGFNQRALLGKGQWMKGVEITDLLDSAACRRESLYDFRLQAIRRVTSEGTSYFIANWSEEDFDEWITLGTQANTARIYDPMLRRKGIAKSRQNENGQLEVYLQLKYGESIILNTYSTEIEGETFPYYQQTEEAISLNNWEVEFRAGGPTLPPTQKITVLSSWTDWEGENFEQFSGTAVYKHSFAKPEVDGSDWLLDLGEVKESAKVVLNGKTLGTLVGPSYQLVIVNSLLQDENVLKIHVSNLMANRIIALEKADVEWKKFYNINFAARLRENYKDGVFTAKDWEPRPSGLLGPVKLVKVNH